MPSIGSFQMQSQLRSQLCWAAVSVSVKSFRVAGATDRQCDVTQSVLAPFLTPGTVCCDHLSACNQNGPLGLALTTLGITINPILHRALTFSEIATQIAAGRVICVGIKWKDRTSRELVGLHFAVIRGHEADTDQTLHVEDPLYDPSDLPYLAFLNSYQDSGVWSETILLA